MMSLSIVVWSGSTGANHNFLMLLLTGLVAYTLCDHLSVDLIPPLTWSQVV